MRTDWSDTIRYRNMIARPLLEDLTVLKGARDTTRRAHTKATINAQGFYDCSLTKETPLQSAPILSRGSIRTVTKDGEIGF